MSGGEQNENTESKMTTESVQEYLERARGLNPQAPVLVDIFTSYGQTEFLGPLGGHPAYLNKEGFTVNARDSEYNARLRLREQEGDLVLEVFRHGSTSPGFPEDLVASLATRKPVPNPRPIFDRGYHTIQVTANNLWLEEPSFPLVLKVLSSIDGPARQARV